MVNTDLLPPLKDPELVVAIVAPIGTDLPMLSKVITECLSEVNYKTISIKVTDALKSLKIDFKLTENPADERYHSYIDAGNKLRRALGRSEAFSLFTIASITSARSVVNKGGRDPLLRTAFVISQFKRPEEIELLRRVYGPNLVQVSAFCAREKRISNLATKIRDSSDRNKRRDPFESKAIDLVNRDADEEDESFGQRVRQTFPLADIVVDASSEASAYSSFNRFLRAFFGDKTVSPSTDEQGMFIAKSASFRSSDLARQVGAAILGCDGSVHAIGCNEVPKVGGGAYWDSDELDARDFKLGIDHGDKLRRDVLGDLIERLQKKGLLRDELCKQNGGDLLNQLLADSGKLAVKESMLMDVIEYGRAVHAEMMAITDASRFGKPIAGSTLYSTTFPCHLCARHIVASGINRVVYIEPYPKSLVPELYADSISVKEGEDPGTKIPFQPFVGISPNRYAELFSKTRWKDADGKPNQWIAERSQPIIRLLTAQYFQNEDAVLVSLAEILDQKKI